MDTSTVESIEIVKSFEVFCRKKCAEETHSLLLMPFLHFYLIRKKIKKNKEFMFVHR
jgi:hypothetical protein